MSNIINKIRISGTDYTLSATTSGGVTSGEVETMISAATSGYTARFAEDEEVTAAALNDLNERISGISGNNVVELTQAQYDALVSGGTVDPTAFYIITDATAGDLTQYWTSAQTQSAITSAVSTKQDTLVSGTNIKTINNESLLGSGNIDIQGGGKAVSGGTNISITTGETADTINCTVPASASSGNYSIMFGQPASSSDASGAKTIIGGQWSKAYAEGSVAIGQMNEARGQWAWAIGNNNRSNGKASFACGNYTLANTNSAFSEGTNTTANTEASHSAGSYTSTKNRSEFSIGEYNNSVSASTTFGNSGNTLFSVGNGTSNNARHNAFEIRQNGDIYLTKDGQDVKLQDQLGGGGGGTVDQTIISGSTNAVAGGAVYNKFDEVEQVTAAGLNAVNDKFDGLKLKKLTQAEYNAIATKDDSTLYVIVN